MLRIQPRHTTQCSCLVQAPSLPRLIAVASWSLFTASALNVLCHQHNRPVRSCNVPPLLSEHNSKFFKWLMRNNVIWLAVTSVAHVSPLSSLTALVTCPCCSSNIPGHVITYSFPITAVANRHKLSGLRLHNCLVLQLRFQIVEVIHTLLMAPSSACKASNGGLSPHIASL